MKLRKLIGEAVIITGLMATAAQAEAVVNVTLIDKLGAGDMGKAVRLGMGLHANMKMAKMGLNINPKVVPHGMVKFNVTNLASSQIHEVIVARVADENQVLAYDESKNMVDEETVAALGSVKEIAPNKTASLTVELTPGKYLLYCNVPGHYMAGMWVLMDVQ